MCVCVNGINLLTDSETVRFILLISRPIAPDPVETG